MPPGGATDADRLVEGAIDFHHHGYPEISFALKSRHEDADELAIARAAAMAGIVLKSHMWPTFGRAYPLKPLSPDIEVITSIPLHPAVGCFSPFANASAALLVARYIYFSHWCWADSPPQEA